MGSNEVVWRCPKCRRWRTSKAEGKTEATPRCSNNKHMGEEMEQTLTPEKVKELLNP
jgi:hypothetical protein